MHAWLFIYFGAYYEQCNICKRATQVWQLSKFRYRLVYKYSNTLYMCAKTLEAMKTHLAE